MIYFVRHGLTDWNENISSTGEKIPKCQGRADIPLNENGINQAKTLCEKLKNINFSIAYCSPLKRTKQTLQYLLDKEIPIIYEEKIIERDFGEFEGLMPTQFDIESFWNENIDQHYIKAETLQQVKNRIYNFLDELKQKYKKEENILVVSHGGISCFFVSYFKGNPPNGNYRSYILKNGEIAKFDL
ncbi:MAG: histidine phosphatase family protein [Clostridia bacterium]|nr:histidine phosphatase family protein [Clostridia bacterium]